MVALEARVLETFDDMISEVLMDEMRKQGIELRMSFQVAGLAETGAGHRAGRRATVSAWTVSTA